MPTKLQNAPDFELPDLHDHTLHLSDFLSQKNIVLVFLRGFM